MNGAADEIERYNVFSGCRTFILRDRKISRFSKVLKVTFPPLILAQRLAKNVTRSFRTFETTNSERFPGGGRLGLATRALISSLSA